MDNRSSVITIDGQEYELLFTNKATKEVSKKYGGLENLGDKLSAEKFEDSLDELFWLVALLANQAILRYNYRHKDNPKDLVTVDELELLTSPNEIAGYQQAITEALRKGTERHVQSEVNQKNVEVG